MKPESELPPLSGYQTFTNERVARAHILEAPYNPRRALTDDERTKLRRLLKKHGLFNALVWNRRTGRLVAGHQRLQVLDALHGGKAFSLDVNVVDVDEKQEREMNVAHNNQMAASDWDLDKLGALLRDGETKLDIEATGFDQADVFKMFGDSPFEERADELAAMADKVREFSEQVTSGTRAAKSESSTDFYTVVVWRDEAARDEGHRLLGFSDVDNRFQDGRALLAKLKLVEED